MVMKRLGWTLEEYAQYKYDAGLMYLSIYLENDPEGQRLLERDRHFWRWWLFRWSTRDTDFLSASEFCSIDVCTDLYKSVHDPFALSRHIKPPRIVTIKAFT